MMLSDLPRSKLMSQTVLDVDNIKPAVMALTMCHKTDTSQVVSASRHANVT